jgi:hypothetical protein
MNPRLSAHRSVWQAWLTCLHVAVLPVVAFAGEAQFTIPYITGSEKSQPFAGHPGWVGLFKGGNATGVGARVGDDARFKVPDDIGNEQTCLIAMFDRIETPPIIVPDIRKYKSGEIPIPTEYACVPPGYPEFWDREYMQRGKDFFQVIVPRCTQLYGLMFYDGPKFADWGNKINVSVHKDSPRGELIMVTEAGEGPSEHVSATHSNHEFPRIGWRHGGMQVEPNRAYAVRVGAYRHGGSHFRLDAFIRPDEGDGYPDGNVSIDGRSINGDLCCLIFGNAHGQLVENHIRSEEWELFIPPHRPTTSWGQSFTAHGVSLAGISFWAGTDQKPEPIECTILIRPDGEWEHPIGPIKVAVGHKSPERPIIRYPEWPSPLEGYESYYKLPSTLFQVAYLPDEVPLEKGRKYYIDVSTSRPIMAYADGDYYAEGYAYYEGLQVDRLAGGGKRTFHSNRWTLAMNIVTYANEKGRPLEVTSAEQTDDSSE